MIKLNCIKYSCIKCFSKEDMVFEYFIKFEYSKLIVVTHNDQSIVLAVIKAIQQTIILK